MAHVVTCAGRTGASTEADAQPQLTEPPCLSATGRVRIAAGPTSINMAAVATVHSVVNRDGNVQRSISACPSPCRHGNGGLEVEDGRGLP